MLLLEAPIENARVGAPSEPLSCASRWQRARLSGEELTKPRNYIDWLILLMELDHDFIRN